MKKIVPALIILMLAANLFSCVNQNYNSSDDSDLIEKYASNTDKSAAFVINYNENCPEWLSLEENYVADENDTAYGIISVLGGAYTETADRLYYPVKIYESYSKHESSYAYISKITGESHLICPDPLCTHLEESDCRYKDIRSIMCDPENPDILYATKDYYVGYEDYISICRIDTKNDSINEICSETSTFLNLKFISDGKLYYTTITHERIENEDKSINTEVVEKLKVLDLESYDVSIADNKYAEHEYGEFYFSDGKYIYFLDTARRCVFVTDMRFNNERVIFRYGEDYLISSMFYDTDTQELYFCVCSMYARGLTDEELIDGYICKVDSKLNCEKVPIPEECIMGFSLTKNYIYYSIYDPKEYGDSPRGGKTVEEDGNIIYRVPRAELTKREIAFDGHGEIFYSSYLPVGNHLYIDYLEMIDMGNHVWFRLVGVTARIDMERQTITWLTSE